MLIGQPYHFVGHPLLFSCYLYRFWSQQFIAGLFDFSFTNLITPKVIKVLYGLFLILWALGILGGLGTVVMMLISGEIIVAFLALLLLPVIALLYLVMLRMYHELIIIAFKMAQNLEQIKNNTAK